MHRSPGGRTGARGDPPRRHGRVDAVRGPAIESPLAPAEIELAVSDAQCRESTGWSQARYEAEWNAQTALIAADTVYRGGVASLHLPPGAVVEDSAWVRRS